MTLPSNALRPGATIGILGGGQLGRMLAMAAAKLGFRAHVFCPDPSSPAFDVVHATTVADYEDAAALARFADSVDVVTYEFENVPAATAELVSNHAPLYPDARALAVAQDRLVEKSFLSGLGIPLAPFAAVEDRASLARAVAEIGRPAVLKTRRFGYDGKGQALLREGLDLDAALGLIEGQPATLEAFVPFALEVSVVAAHGRDGSFAAFDATENRHRDHILKTSRAPAAIRPDTAADALRISRLITDALGYVGVIGVEMFVLREGGGERVLVNELAPRVHNSGHWTLDGAATSQFEQHIRAIAGWPLGSAERLGDVEMTNLIGADIDEAGALASEPGARLHLYGKDEAWPGRKMGHVTRMTVRKA